MSFQEYLKENEEILVPNFGSVTKEALYNEILQRLNEVLDGVKENKFGAVYAMLYKGATEDMIKSMAEAQKAEMESPEE
jgi:hypothetical protein